MAALITTIMIMKIKWVSAISQKDIKSDNEAQAPATRKCQQT
jgi:hypothetical protein